MNFSEIQKLTEKRTVLIAPLDWGLGHANRCIPIINQLLSAQCRVIIAADGAQHSILSEAFPFVEILVLPGYKIKYSRNPRLFVFKAFTQIPKILRIQRQEQRWLKKVAIEYKISAVISDNRFGLYHSSLPCVYITHQVAIKTGWNFLDTIASGIHQNIIKKYSSCWIPDEEQVHKSVAGYLSHPANLPGNSSYIGCISRFQQLPFLPKLFNIVAVISGPEPQRTILEKLLLYALGTLKGKNLLIRGLPASKDELNELETPHLTIKNHLNQKELNHAMMQAEIVVCRSGYTTIMDLLKIRQKAILIPTPGQAEQEYLASYLLHKKIFYSVAQQDLKLDCNVAEAGRFPYDFPRMDMELYKQVITQFVQSL